jgi:hypothetical protein
MAGFKTDSMKLMVKFCTYFRHLLAYPEVCDVKRSDTV